MFQKESIQAFAHRQAITNRSIRTIKTSLHKTSRLTNNKQCDYFLYAQCMLHQLQQQMKYGFLKEAFLRKQTEQICKITKKCEKSNRIKITLKIVSIYCKMNLKVCVFFMDFCSEMLENMTNFGQNYQQTIVDMVILDRLDEVLMYLYRKYKQKSEQWRQKIVKICNKINHINLKIKQKIPKSQYADIMRNVHLLCMKGMNAKSLKRDKGNQRVMKISQKSKQSFTSMSSENSQAYLERLRKFDETNQKQQFQQQLLLIQRKNKKRPGWKPSAALRKTPKRISNSWNKHAEISHYSNADNKSSFNFVYQKITAFHQELESQYNSVRRDQSMRQSSEKQKINPSQFKFRPFYLFTYQKGDLRCLEVTQAKVEEIGNYFKMYIKIQGDRIGNNLIIKRSRFSIKNSMDSNQFAYFISHSIKIIKKKVWSVFMSRINKQAEQKYSAKSKNILVTQKENMKQINEGQYYGFIEIDDGKFFAIFHQKQPHCQGIFTIMDKTCQIVVEQKTIMQKDALKVLNKAEKNFNKNRADSKKIYEITNLNCNQKIMKTELAYSQPDIQKIKVINTQNNQNEVQNQNQIFEVVKVNGKYRVICNKIDRNSKKLIVKNSLKSYTDYLLSNRVFHQTINQDHKNNQINLAILNKKFIDNQIKKQGLVSTVLSLKQNVPRQGYIEHQQKFVKKMMKDQSFLVCRTLIFNRRVSDLLLLQIYHCKMRKYYQIQLEGSFLQEIFGIHWPSFNLKMMAQISKQFKINYLQSEINGPPKFQLNLLGNLIIFKQILVRNFSSKSNIFPKKIHSIFKLSQQWTSDLSLRVILRKQTLTIQKKLRSSSAQNQDIIKSDASHISKYQYPDLIRDCKAILENQLRKRKINKLNTYYYISSNENIIIKAQKNQYQWGMTMHPSGHEFRMKLSRLFGEVWEKMDGKSLGKLLKRSLKDKVCRNLMIR